MPVTSAALARRKAHEPHRQHSGSEKPWTSSVRPRTQYEHWQDVHVVDVAGDIATVVVRSQPFDEYLHLGRFDGRWLIINALYVRHDT